MKNDFSLGKLVFFPVIFLLPVKKSFGKLNLYGLEEESPFSVNNPY